MLNNIPQVTKNLLLLNIAFFIATLILEIQGIDLRSSFGIHAINSALFRPYQIITHFFMHENFMHLFYNMFGLFVFGSHLERFWGEKKFFIFYFLVAIGSFAVLNIISVYELTQIKSAISKDNLILLDKYIDRGDFNFSNYYSGIRKMSPESINNIIADRFQTNYNELFKAGIIPSKLNINDAFIYCAYSSSYTIGASGAIFGIMAAFGILFPNTELMLLFLPIPIKAKYLIGLMFLIQVYQFLYPSAYDNTSHIGHIGGAVIGAIIVLIGRKKDRTNFW
jgi:membrane associated rhomboid family serine protease